jgi:hypothetical protein
MLFVNGVVLSIFAMAVQQGIPFTKEAQNLLHEVQSEILRTQKSFSAYPVEIKLAPNDAPAAA